MRTSTLQCGWVTSAPTVVTRREGESDVWREVLAMNPRWTETRIDDFITAPTDMGLSRDYERLVLSLHMRAARASADRRCPVDSPPLCNDEWRTMQREDEWVRRATQSHLPMAAALERAELVLSMLSTLSHEDARLYIGWVIRLRAKATRHGVKRQAARSLKKDKRK